MRRGISLLLAVLFFAIAPGVAGAADKVKITVWGRDLLDG